MYVERKNNQMQIQVGNTVFDYKLKYDVIRLTQTKIMLSNQSTSKYLAAK